MLEHLRLFIFVLKSLHFCPFPDWGIGAEAEEHKQKRKYWAVISRRTDEQFDYMMAQQITEKNMLESSLILFNSTKISALNLILPGTEKCHGVKSLLFQEVAGNMSHWQKEMVSVARKVTKIFNEKERENKSWEVAAYTALRTLMNSWKLGGTEESIIKPTSKAIHHWHAGCIMMSISGTKIWKTTALGYAGCL